MNKGSPVGSRAESRILSPFPSQKTDNPETPEIFWSRENHDETLTNRGNLVSTGHYELCLSEMQGFNETINLSLQVGRHRTSPGGNASLRLRNELAGW